ncbi:GGDEF domain-containing protein [Mesorhizobium australicum]|uniref:Diguanylate cyclase n=1 Tax=Mesorhizobium australicum TaxID=536018 RepID=A0A1X7PJN3_9HYPH|nr:sensor domain-containing diguanylate cyclase [Mesorhizobium australicum]SMH51077.1 diguanylate cyclase [Mesorhizobium australicum]
MSRLDSAVSQDQRSHAKTSLASGPLGRIFYWLSSSGQPDSDELRGRLIQSIMDRKGALLVGTAVVIATATFAYFMTGAWWPIIWLVTEIVIVAVRLAVISHAERTLGRRREDYVPALLTLGALWTVVFGAGSYACMTSGEPVLAIIASVNTAGAVGAMSSRNAPTPRFASLIMVICCIPFAIASLNAPYPGIGSLAIILPLWVVGMHVIMFQNHDILVRMIRAEKVTRRLAMTDALTGLQNRMALDEKLADMCARLERRIDGDGFSLLYLDLDGFKAVNDRHGHTAGDVLLKAVAERIRHALRPDDHASRNGGDEFSVILPLTGREETAFVAKRLIATISRPFEIGIGDTIQLGVSIGSAYAPDDGLDPAILLASADEALYAAKRAGKGIHREYRPSDDGPPNLDGRARA